MLNKLSTKSIFLIFLIVHALLFNINSSEWGDSYRILRASNFIKYNHTYPDDEKRPPLYSAVLSIRPDSIDPVFWSRGVMFVISIGTFFVFAKLLDYFLIEEDLATKKLALLLFIFNPVYLYWSIRVMSDVFFSLLVMLAFYFHLIWLKKNTDKHLYISGLFVGLSVLTRFEGFILGFALGLGILFQNMNFSFASIKAKLLPLLKFGISSMLFIVPWWIYRNPFTSVYFEEPSGRTYDMRMIWIYIASLIFVFGTTTAVFFISKLGREIRSITKLSYSVGIFVVLELMLALLWPAAIPRLFVPIIPFLIVLLSSSMYKFLKTNMQALSKWDVALLIGLIASYTVSQYYLRLQFLIPIRHIFIFVVALQIFSVLGLYIKSYSVFIFSMFFSLIIWSFATIYLHKDIFKVIKEANVYIVENIEGRVAYNDISSVSDWYLNQMNMSDKVDGIYVNMDNKKGRSYENLIKNDIDYVLVTNEHNTDLEFSVSEVDYLEEIKEFRYTIGGKDFFAKIAKFKNAQNK